MSGKGWLSKKLFKEFSYSKPREKKTFSSITTFLFSCGVLLAIFPREIAFVSILLLIFGDMFAKIFGLSFKRHAFLNKSLEGSLAFLGCGFIIAYLLNLFFAYNLAIILVGTFFAVVGEAAIEKIDDNLTIPFISGFAMWLLNMVGVARLIQ